MNHLVSLAYTDHIRPQLLKKVGGGKSVLSPWHLPRANVADAILPRWERQTLYLGLSDGARN